MKEDIQPQPVLTEQVVHDQGMAAGNVMNSDPYKAAWEQAQRQIVREWLNSLPGDGDKREELWQRWQGLRAIHRELNNFLADAKSIAIRKQKKNAGTKSNYA